MRALAITGIVTASWISSIFAGRTCAPRRRRARMSAGTRSSAITATAPASSAIFACSALTTSMITPPLSISARPALTLKVPVSMGHHGIRRARRAYVATTRECLGRPGPAGRVARARRRTRRSTRRRREELGDLSGGRRLGLVTRSCGSTPARGGGRCWRERRGAPARRGAAAGAQRPDVPHHERASPLVREAGGCAGCRSRARGRVPSRVDRGHAQVRADRARLHLRGQVRHLVVAERQELQHLVPRRVRAAGRSSCARRSRSARRGPRAPGSSTAAAGARAGSGSSG